MDSATLGMIMWVVIFIIAFKIRRVSRNKMRSKRWQHRGN